jgi:hypothetical protein
MIKHYNKIIVIVVSLILLGGGFYTYKLSKDAGSPPEQVLCTMEALQCPDGSFVGRGGPKCEFVKCPDQSSFVGTLRQTSEGFDLIMASPENSGGMEVSYVMPISIKVSNVLGQMVGKKVKVFGFFTEGNKLNVDRLEELKESDSSVGDVKVGQTVFINGVKITLNKIVQDSRCPANVVCVWAGNVTANVTLQSNTDKETLDISSDKGATAFDSYQVSLEKVVSPSSKVDGETETADYVLTFKVLSN